MIKLIADIGATNARFAVVNNGTIESVDILQCADYPTLSAAASAYMAQHRVRPQTAVFAMAMPVDGSDHVRMTNNHWEFSIETTRQELGFSRLRLINDFAAIAHAMPYLGDTDRFRVCGGDAVKGLPIGIIGPGTGLGVAGVVFEGDRPIVVTSEGGHVTMPADTAREFALFDYLRKTKYSHVSAERVVSGKGLVNLYNAICGVDGVSFSERDPASIAQAGMSGACTACGEALAQFCKFLGVAAGNLALSFGARGGIYIAGGIVPQLGDYFPSSGFAEAFVSKGRFRPYLEAIPVYVVTHKNPGLEGLRHA